MVGTMKPGGDAKPPSEGVGVLAGLLRAIQEISPKELKRIEDAITGYHEAKAAADARVAEAERKEAELADAETAHAGKVRIDIEALDQRQQAVSRREGECQRREQTQNEKDKALLARATAVTDGERRIARTREQLGAVG